MSQPSLINILANLSATDSWHDFHSDIKGIQYIIEKNEGVYCSGLPKGVTDLGRFSDEDNTLNSVVNQINGAKIENFGVRFPQSMGMGVGVYKGAQIPKFTIGTINENKYSVTSLVVASGSKKSEAGKSYLEAGEFVTGLGIEDKCAIIVDAAAVSILTILKSGPTLKQEMYYVLTPEVVNDPAGKTGVDNDVFDGKNGIKLIPCEPNCPESFNYNYSYADEINSGDKLKNLSVNPYDKFFSAYNFQLSEVQRNRKGKKTVYTTNLLIKSNDKSMPITEDVKDSKTKNNITFLKSILVSTINALNGKKDLKKNNFLFNAKFQQKRSGDWLQVLVCLILKSRKLKQYAAPGKAPGDQSIEDKITKVYFVTHDRVALAFALLLGVQCIYTHAKTKSCYIFKAASPEALELESSTLLGTRISELGNMLIILSAVKDNFVSVQERQYTLYNSFKQTKIISFCENQILTTIPGKYPQLFVDGAPFNSSDFNQFTAETFEICLLYDYLLLNYPDLKFQYEELTTKIDQLTDRITQLLADINKRRTAKKNPQTASVIVGEKESDMKKCISDYESILACASTLETTLDKYVTQKDPSTIIGNIENTILSFQKTPNRKLASGWSWDNTSTGSRVWEAFKNVVGAASSKSDKNAFLYSLDLLPVNIKNHLSTKYFQINQRVFLQPSVAFLERAKRNDQPITSSRLIKFKSSAQGFIAEVFLNFGSTPIQPSIPAPEEVLYPFTINEDYERIIKDALTSADPNSILSEESIVSENSQATLVNMITGEEPQSADETGNLATGNFSENLIQANKNLNYSTSVEKVGGEDEGTTITDPLAVSKTKPELLKKKKVVAEIIAARTAEAADAGGTELVSFRKLRSGAMQSTPAAGTPQNLADIAASDEEQTNSNTENTTINTDLSSLPPDPAVSSALPPIPPEDDNTRLSLDISSIASTPPSSDATIVVEPNSRRIDADFETSIKDATYTLVNAILLYKNDPGAIARLKAIIDPILRKIEPDTAIFTQTLEDSGDLESAETSSVSSSTAASGSETSSVAGPEPEPAPPAPAPAPGPVKRRGKKGGVPLFTIESEKRTALAELFDRLNLTSPDSQSISLSETGNMLKDINYMFHPLFPIYMIAESLNEIVGNDNVEDSLDYDLYLNYFNFLRKMREELVEVYSSKTPMDVAMGFMIGAGLKEFLFTTNIDSLNVDLEGGAAQVPSLNNMEVAKVSNSNEGIIGDGEEMVGVAKGKNGEEDLSESSSSSSSSVPDNSYCVRVIGMPKEEFLPISILTGVFKDFITGSVIRSEEEIENGKIILKSTIFKNYIKNIDIPSIFRVDADTTQPIESFKQKCMIFLLETGNIIISERGGTPIQIPVPISSEEVVTSQVDVGMGFEKEEPEMTKDSYSDLGMGVGMREGLPAAGAGGSKKRRAKKNKRTIKQNRKTKRKVTKFYRDKIKKYTRKHKKTAL